ADPKAAPEILRKALARLDAETDIPAARRDALRKAIEDGLKDPAKIPESSLTVRRAAAAAAEADVLAKFHEAVNDRLTKTQKRLADAAPAAAPADPLRDLGRTASAVPGRHIAFPNDWTERPANRDV